MIAPYPSLRVDRLYDSSFYGVLNTYVWVLSIAWTPVIDDRNQVVQAAAETELSSFGGVFASLSSEGTEVYRDQPPQTSKPYSSSSSPASPSALSSLVGGDAADEGEEEEENDGEDQLPQMELL